MAADYLNITEEETQSIAVGMVAFLLALAGDTSEMGPMENPPVVDQGVMVKTQYFALDGSQGALESIAQTFGITGSEAQKFSSSVLVFLVALAQASSG